MWEPIIFVLFVKGRNSCLLLKIASGTSAIRTLYDHRQYVELIIVHLCSHYRQYINFLMKHSTYNYHQRMK